MTHVPLCNASNNLLVMKLLILKPSDSQYVGPLILFCIFLKKLMSLLNTFDWLKLWTN